MNYKLLPPAPSASIEAYTGVGYTLKTSLADLIDNSITAQAKNIWLDFYWDGVDSTISVLDDGIGMDEAELSEAMRPGGKNPIEVRDKSDLGRFSLGLKTASWAQCRCLSVYSKKKLHDIHSMSWDLDYVTLHNEWRAFNDLSYDNNDLVKLSELNSGTFIKWTKLSSPLFKELVQSANSRDLFNEHIEEIQIYLGMIFHRFIQGAANNNSNKGPISLFVNGYKIEPWDPFVCSNNVKASSTPLEPQDYLGNLITIKGYVMPHKDRLSEKEIAKGGGPSGWLEQQGFYVYRADRLLVAGSWLGLGVPKKWQKDEQYKLARIAIDIPNSVDKEWSLDIKKSMANPPPQLRQKLTICATTVRDEARQTFVARGKYGRRPERRPLSLEPVWIRSDRDQMIGYRVSKSHPLIADFKKKLGPLSEDFEVILRLLQESIPVQRIWLDAADSEQNNLNPYDGITSDLKSDLNKTYRVLLHTMSSAKAKDTLRVIEPFNRFENLIDELID
jgi:hypothetical protein